MRFFFILLIGFYMVLPTASFAQAPSNTKTPAIILPQDKPKKEKVEKKYTRAQLEDMNQIYLTCAQSPQIAYYNCSCAAMKYLDFITGPEKNQDRNTLILDAYVACPDIVASAGTAYKSCVNWAPVFHPNPEKFCTCYARRFSTLFKKNYRTFIRDEEKIRRTAMTECDFIGPILKEFKQNIPPAKPFLNP